MITWLTKMTKNESQLHYQSLNKSSPVIWKAAKNRAVFIDKQLKAGRSAFASFVGYMRLLKTEADAETYATPSFSDVVSAIDAHFPEQEEREQALQFYRELCEIRKKLQSSKRRQAKGTNLR